MFFEVYDTDSPEHVILFSRKEDITVLLHMRQTVLLEMIAFQICMFGNSNYMASNYCIHYENLPMQYTDIQFIVLKIENFQLKKKNNICFLFLLKT